MTLTFKKTRRLKLIFVLSFFSFLIFSNSSHASEAPKTLFVDRLDYVNVVPPVYPELARQKGWQGTVMLKTLVEKDGSCAQVVVEKSSGHVVLDEAALNAVKNWEFSPARIGNEPYAVLTRVPIRFVLVDKK